MSHTTDGTGPDDEPSATDATDTTGSADATDTTGVADAIDSSIAGRTVLVTGGAGFIGAHVAAALAGANDVRVFDDLSTGERKNVPADATLIEGDVRDREALADAMAGVDLVFHLAAMVSVPQSVEQPDTCQSVNTGGTVKLLERARIEDARVILSSSAAIYGRPARIPIEEGDPKTPRSPYGISKLAADGYVRAYADLYGLETVSLRYFNAYGAYRGSGEPGGGVVATFVKRARANQQLVIEGDGSQTRDFVHTTDIVRANLAAATTEHTGEAYNVSTGTSVTIDELAGTIRDLSGSDVPIVHTDARTGDIERSRADPANARRDLGYEPTVPLADGLASLLGIEREASIETDS
jgi:UDP-glucose 4-epimerase